MNIRKLIKNLNFSPSKEELKFLEEKTKEIVEKLKREIVKNKFDADVFVGGSFAKGTLAKEEDYDIDIFIRFGWKEQEHLSEQLEKIVEGLDMLSKKVHGSRDYFRVSEWDNLTFEIIPVLRIKRVGEAQNVTDQSYFHVNYVRRKIKGKLNSEVSLAKTFFKCNGIYGAESYINGFSGYGIECLIINYESFEKMLKSLVKVKKSERLIIDPKKHYKKKEEILFNLNESKIHGPIILVDPTWKERNVLAALSGGTFEKFQEIALKFLSRPSEKFFYMKKLDVGNIKAIAKKRKAEFLHLILETNRQEGDIAGTKMKKFSNFLTGELKKYFDILESEFDYKGAGNKAEIYFVLKSKKEIVRIGPPLKMEKSVKEFKRRNKETFEKNGFMHSRVKIDFSAADFLKNYFVENKGKLGEMGIVGIEFRD